MTNGTIRGAIDTNHGQVSLPQVKHQYKFIILNLVLISSIYLTIFATLYF
jgi:hypothetical protein